MFGSENVGIFGVQILHVDFLVLVGVDGVVGGVQNFIIGLVQARGDSGFGMSMNGRFVVDFDGLVTRG